jgi:hypothetical protein
MRSASVGSLTSRPEDAVRPLYSRVRSDDHYVIALIRKGYEGSVAFRELDDAIQRSDVIVFVQPGLCAGGRIRTLRAGPVRRVRNGASAAS